jgi:WD40 repeat protein
MNQIKKALVIGISDYKHKPLNNPSNDAASMAEVLSDKGFDVTKEIDLTSSAFFSAINNFCKDVEGQVDVILFYFAGHGLECEGKNYFLPRDYDGSGDLGYEAPTLEDICKHLKKISETAIKIIILDACRNDGNDDLLNMILSRAEIANKPIRIGQTKPIIQDANIFIAFSTAPGMKASDKGVSGKNGLFTECLLESITKYGMSIEDLFRTVRESVIKKSEFDQIPWEHSSLNERYSFDNFDVPCHLVDIVHLPFDTLYTSQFTSDSNSVILAGDGNKILAHNFKDFRDMEITIGEIGLHCEVVCVSDEYIFIGDSEGYLSSFWLKKNKKDKAKIFDSDFFALSIAHNKESVVTCGDNGILKKIAIDDLSVVNKMQLDIPTIYCVQHLPASSKKVLVCGSHYKLQIWDVDVSSNITKLKNNSFYTYAAKFSNDGSLLATVHESGVIKIWSTEKFSLVKEVKLARNVENTIVVIETRKDGVSSKTNHIVSLSFSPDSKTLAVGTSDSSVVFVDVKYGEIIKVLRLDSSVLHVYSISQSNTEPLLVCSGHKRTAYVFSINETPYIDSSVI